MSLDFVSSLLYLLRDSTLFFGTIGSHPSFVLCSGSPDRLIRFGVLLEFIDEVIKVLLLLLAIF